MPGSNYGIPSKSGSGGLIAIGILTLLAGTGLVLFKLEHDQESRLAEPAGKEAGEEAPNLEGESTAAERVQAAAQAAPALQHAPPPPPSEEELEEEGEVESPATANAPPQAAATGRAGCEGSCIGRAGSALRSALATRGAAARSCYNMALRRNEGLGGKMTIQMRLSSSGAVCSVQVVDDSLGDSGVAACVIAKFRSARFPAPTGGCVDAAVPLNFTSQP